MAITYKPDQMLKKIAPEKKIKNLLSSGVTLKKAALSFVDDIEFLDKKGVKDTALKVIKSYKARIKEDPEEKPDIVDDPALLISRVQSEIVNQVANQIRDKYEGETYTWLPSSADTPDPEHQLNYGKIFTLGDGEMPGDRFGCQCGMEIHTEDTKLRLGEGD